MCDPDNNIYDNKECARCAGVPGDQLQACHHGGLLDSDPVLQQVLNK